MAHAPLLIGLCMLNAAQATWHIADLHFTAKLRRAQAVADSNLRQAERKWIACIDDGYFTVGTAIYLCRARKLALTVAHVPEIGM